MRGGVSEDGVLEMVHGQAMVVRGARCQGISACERECPVGAIKVTLDDLEERDDIPALTRELEAVGTPGLYLAGEVTAHALIKTAIEHGIAVAGEVSRRVHGGSGSSNGLDGNGTSDVLDLCNRRGRPGGTGLLARSQAPRPVVRDTRPGVEPRRHGGEVPAAQARHDPAGRPSAPRSTDADDVHQGRADRSLARIAKEQELPLRGGEVFESLEKDEAGHFVVWTKNGSFTAKNVCLALGRRGIPRKLGVPGEELSKVAYSLLDANSYQNRRVLVVGGGDSAVEAAMGLAEQPGNRVTALLSKGQLLPHRVEERSAPRALSARRPTRGPVREPGRLDPGR